MNAHNIFEVFRAGKSVANPEAWKKGTVSVNTILVLISGALSVMNFFDCSFCNFKLTSEEQLNIALGIMTIAGIFNAGSTAATTEKIGISPKAPIASSESDIIQTIKDLQE